MSVVESRNEVADPNGLPSGPASLVGNGATVTQVSDPLAAAGTSYRMAHSSVATGGGLVVAGAVTPGQRWHGRAKFHRTSAELGARQFGCQLLFQDAAGNNLFDNLANAVVQSIPAGVFHRWMGASNGSISERYEGATRRVNKALDPFATSQSWWSRWFGSGTPSGTYESISGANDGPEGITSYVRKTWTTASTSGANGNTGFNVNSAPISAKPGDSISVSGWFRSNLGGLHDVKAKAQFVMSDGSYNAALGQSVAVPVGQWVRLTLTTVIPAGATGYYPLLDVDSNDTFYPVGTRFEATGALCEDGNVVGQVFAGSSPNSGDGTDLTAREVALSAVAPAGAARAVLFPYREQVYQATASDVTHVFNLMLTQADQENPPPYGDGDRPGWFWSGARGASASYSLAAQGTIIEPDAGRMGVQLLDAKGVLWDLINGPVRLTRAGLKGLGLPEIVYFTSESAGLDGERVTGWRLKAREVFAPVRFKDEAMADTTGLQRTFWDGLQIGKPIQFIVTDRDGAVRTLTMRLADDGGLSYKMSPDLIHVDSIGLGFTAADPWWYGPAVETSYTIGADTGADFFGGAANAPDFNIVSAGGSTATTVTNPGEEPMWLKWTIGGPSSQFRVGVGGKRISQSLVIPDGQWLVIDTDPRVQTAYLGSTKIPFRAFSELNFAPVPPGANVPVTIEIVGQGIITAQGRPKYRRAL